MNYEEVSYTVGPTFISDYYQLGISMKQHWNGSQNQPYNNLGMGLQTSETHFNASVVGNTCV